MMINRDKTDDTCVINCSLKRYLLYMKFILCKVKSQIACFMLDSLFFIDISQVSIKSWDPTVNFTLYFGSHKVNNFNVDLYLDYLLIDILFLIYTYDKIGRASCRERV